MITIAEVIEQCALEAEAFEPRYDDNRIAEAIRALAAQYEGFRVIEPDAVIYKRIADNYRAKEPTK